MTPKNPYELTNKEIAERMDKTLKRLISSPPKPFTPAAKKKSAPNKRAPKSKA